MIIEAFFDDDDHEFLDISLSDFYKVEEYQSEFFSWLFDKNNDHKYWVVFNGHKIGCDYGIEAFIDWIRLYHNVGIRRIKPSDDNTNIPTLFF